MIPIITRHFVPKKRGAVSSIWILRLERVGAETDYDYNLVLENPDTKASYTLEVGINADDSMSVRATSDGGRVEFSESLPIITDHDMVRASFGKESNLE